MRQPRPTLSEIPPSASVDPRTAEQLEFFWDEVGNDAMYDIGLSRQVRDSCLTPIYLFVRRSLVFPGSYLSSMNLDVDLVPIEEEMSEEAFVAFLVSRLSRTGFLERPEGALHFRFARLESMGAEADPLGFFRKQLSVFGRIPDPGSLPFRGGFRLVITRPPEARTPLVLRPCHPIGTGK